MRRNREKRPINRPFSRPALVTTSLNIEGLSVNKEILIADMCKRRNCDILVLQETHRGPTSHRPKIAGMELVLERPHSQYGSAIFARPDLVIRSTACTCNDDVEILTIELESCTVTSVYKPPNTTFEFAKPGNFGNQKAKLVIGDFNCHSVAWGYPTTDVNGEALELWAEQNDLKLIHDPKLPSSFNSARWRQGYNPDNLFVSEAIAQQAVKYVESPLPRTQHRAITCSIEAVIKTETVPFKRRFNFKKAKWDMFAQDLDREITKLEPMPESYEAFVNMVKRISRKHIPRGCQVNYIAGLDHDSLAALNSYGKLFDEDPFSDETINTGERLLSLIAESRRERWCNLLEQLDMKRNSRRAWKLLKNLSNDPTTNKSNVGDVTANQIAHQLLLNGKTARRSRRIEIEREQKSENHFLDTPFTLQELQVAIKQMKEHKAAGVDDLRTEQIKQFGPVTKTWLLNLINNCVNTLQIPKEWRRARVIALLKPGKEPNNCKSYRPVSLLCHLFKCMERMIFNRISEKIDQSLIPEQAGFRPGRSCCGQILNLTQHIEDGYERGQVTGVAFIDLSAAYDTINHRKLTHKLYNLTKDYRLTKFIECTLQNRRFYVTLQGKDSRWRQQKNGLAQGSVLAPLLYNIYTNDQPNSPKVRRFIYADDTAVAVQGKTFDRVEEELGLYLENLGLYYEQNNLKPNPSKTQVCAFHLRNKEAKRKLRINWMKQELEHCDWPKYLGVKLDRTLSYRTHCQDTKMKVAARNNIIRKLTSTTWGAKPGVLRTSAVALCLSTAEYAAPVWANSVHSRHVDTAVNETGRIISGCLKPTPVEKIFPIIGIAPPPIRRTVAAEVERKKQISDPRHPLFHHQPIASRLKSRRSFIQSTVPLTTTPEQRRLNLWQEKLQNPLLELKESASCGSELPFTTWKSLNRLRTGVTRCKTNLLRWGYIQDNAACDCGLEQNYIHLLQCELLDTNCSHDDLLKCNDKALQVAKFWEGNI